jgi:type II secretory pathway pseudopilin PulG
MSTRSKSTLFLIEQLIVIAVFALCAAACIRILTSAYFDARDSRDIGHALIIAENCAESYKAVSGDIAKVAEILGWVYSSVDGAPAVFAYFDRQWHACGIDDAYYIFSLVSESPGPASPLLSSGELSVKTLTGEVILTFSVTARKV